MTDLGIPRIVRTTLHEEFVRICDAGLFGFLITVPLVWYSTDPFTVAISTYLGVLALLGASGLLTDDEPE
jgi:hypothetical protein